MFGGVKLALFRTVAGGEFCPNFIFFQVDFLLKKLNCCLINNEVLVPRAP